MLGQDRIGNEDTVLHAALGHRATAFAEQLRRNSAKHDRRRRFAIRHDKADRHAVGSVADRAFFDHPAKTSDAAIGRFSGRDVSGRVEIGSPVLQAPHRQQNGDKHGNKGHAHQHQALVLGFHLRASASAAASARRIEA